MRITRKIAAAAAALAVVGATAGPAAAATVQYGSFICGSPRQLIISSDTVGTTQHEANGRIWEKGWVDHPNTRRSTWTNKSSGASASIYSSNVIISTPGHRRFYCA